MKNFLLKYLPVIVTSIATIIMIIEINNNGEVPTKLMAAILVVCFGTDIVIGHLRKKHNKH